jgi:hypothetical protein
MRNRVERLSHKDWKQPLPGEESIYILIAEKKAILAKTSELIRNSRKEVQIRLIFEGDKSDGLLKEKVNKLSDGTSVHIKFNPEALNHFIMSDDKEALITTSKESGLGESPSLWTNNNNLIGALRTAFESDWKKAQD